MSSIVDVAKHAKVSIATVSRILNGERNVTAETTKRVEASMKELGYIPKAVRPGPKPKNRKGITTGTLALISVGSFSTTDMYHLPAFSTLLGGIQRGIEKNGMELVLAHLPEGKVVPPVLARRRADGVLLLGTEILSAKLKSALNRVPAVWCFMRDALSPTSDIDHVLYDNSQVGCMAADYLLGQGNKRLIYVGSRSNHPALAQRREQFMKTAAERGVEVDLVEGPKHADSVIRPSVLEAVAARALEHVEKSGPHTGLFVGSDDLMVRVYNHLRRANIEPHVDLDMIGCNNDRQFMDQMHPRPATIDIKLDTVGERAVEHLLWRMSHPNDIAQARLLIKPELVFAEH